eukprot:118951-Amphidinium_carterae.2
MGGDGHAIAVIHLSSGGDARTALKVKKTTGQLLQKINKVGVKFALQQDTMSQMYSKLERLRKVHE